MENLNELEIAKAYEGKPFIPEKVWKIAICSGNTQAVVYSRRIAKSQGALIGVTDDIFYKWWDDGIHVLVRVDLIEPANIIERCSIEVNKDGYREDGKHYFIKIDPTQQELEIFQNIMEYVTK
jgi:hypothetical protein